MAERSRISIQLESGTNERPSVFVNLVNFTTFDKHHPDNRERFGYNQRFNQFSQNKFVLVPKGVVNMETGIVCIQGHEVTTALSVPVHTLVPVVFAVERVSSEDEMLVQYHFPESDCEPRVLHSSFLKTPVFNYNIGTDRFGISYRLQFRDTTPRQIRTR